jgi:protein-tyrosine phosphatase
VIDLHCHILPGIDDGAADLAQSLAMARACVDDGVSVVACTPHILPAVYDNRGPAIREATAKLQLVLQEHHIPLRLVTGADNHIVPDFVDGLRSGRLLSLADSRYVLVEPPHHVAPVRLEDLFFGLIVAGYVPILTHPERLSWIEAQYAMIIRLRHAGVWMQVTAGSLLGGFGRRARYWAERMLDEGHVHLLASDAHDTDRRPPNLRAARDVAVARVGEAEAQALVLTRPLGIVENGVPTGLPEPAGSLSGVAYGEGQSRSSRRIRGAGEGDSVHTRLDRGGIARWLRRLLKLFKR